MTFGEVGVQPDLDPAVAVDADEVFLGMEVAHKVEQLFEAVEAAEQHVQILGVGDIFDVAESDRHVLDVDSGVVVGIAELLGLLAVDELGVDDGVLSLPPLEKLQVFLVLGLVVEVDLVLLDLLVGEVVAEEIGEAVFRAVVAAGGGDEMPVLALEGGGLIRF